MFRKIKGQETPIALLQKAIENDRIAQAYLFHGSDGVGKYMTALYFGMALNCLASEQLKPCGVCSSCNKFLHLEHPDLVFIFPSPNFSLSSEGEIKKEEHMKQYQAYIQNKIHTPWQEYFFKETTEIRRDTISYLLKRLELSIHEARYRVVIIEQADTMNMQTANAFLKTLEEPPANTVIILITERLQMILPTILSRTQPVFFKPLTSSVVEDILKSQFEIGESKAKVASRVSAGNLKIAYRIASDSTSVSRDWAIDLINLAAKRDDLGWLTHMDKTREMQKKEQVTDLLKYLRVLVSDITMLSLDEDSDITNIDMETNLRDIVQDKANLDERSYDYLLFLEDIGRKVDGNVNMWLIMLSLYYKTRLLLHG